MTDVTVQDGIQPQVGVGLTVGVRVTLITGVRVGVLLGVGEIGVPGVAVLQKTRVAPACGVTVRVKVGMAARTVLLLSLLSLTVLL